MCKIEFNKKNHTEIRKLQNNLNIYVGYEKTKRNGTCPKKILFSFYFLWLDFFYSFIPRAKTMNVKVPMST